MTKQSILRNSCLQYLLTTLIILFTASINVMADTSDYHLRRFTNTNWLRDKTTLCALRDKYGFLWVGTTTGLDCFDGNGSSVYNKPTGVLRSTESNSINLIYEHDDDIWFGGTSGLYIFNRKDNTYAPFPYTTKYGVQISSKVQKIISTHNGKIWICTDGQGIFVFDPKSGNLAQDSRHGIFFSDMAVGKNGIIYAANINGYVSAFNSDGKYLYTCHLPDYTIDKNNIYITSSDGDIYIQANTQIYRLDTRTHVIERKNSISMRVSGMLAGHDGALLLGTANGVWLYDTHTGETSRLDPPFSYTYGLADQTVNSLCWDSDGSLIVSTPSGISYMERQMKAFSFTALPEATMREGACNYVNALCPSADGKGIWVGTDRGLYFYDNSIRSVNINGDEVTSIMTDGKLLWVGLRHKGVRVLDTSNGSIKSYTYSNSTPYSLISNDVNGFYRTKDGEIFVLTNLGLCRYSRDKEQFMTFYNLSQQTSFTIMQEDRHRQLWAATENRGLYMRKGRNSMFNPFDIAEFGRTPVTAMCLDRNGVLWTAVQGIGIYFYDDTTNNFKPLDIPLLNGKTVLFMETDKKGFIWIGLRDAILKVDASHKTHNAQLYSYTRNTDFYPIKLSSCRLADGHVLFGSGNGFFAFDPQMMSSDDRLANVYLQSVSFPYLSNSETELSRLKLNVPLYMQEEIRLPYSDNTFTLRFSVSRYCDMPQVSYDYRMCGLSKEWVKGAVAPEITFTGLAPGTYEFQLKCSDNKSAKISTLRIVILPPWYRTLWAYMAYIIAVALLAWYVFLRTKRIVTRRYNKRMHEYKERKKSEMFKAKIQFFVNLIHEIRTPLTLMSLPMERMEEDIKSGKPLSADESMNHIMSMRRNMHYLLDITNEMLDFQKAENMGDMKLNLQQCDVNALMQNICQQFEHPMEVGGKTFKYSLLDNDINTALDIDKMKRVLMNLISNAMKYSKHEVEVSVRCIDDDIINICVADDGPGIPESEHEKIFDMYYQIANDQVAASLGTGLGLAYAKMLVVTHGGSLSIEEREGGGSVFVINMPVRHDNVASTDMSMQMVKDATDIAVDTSVDTHKFCVLIVEDNEELINMTADALKQWYKVKKAHDGVEALEVMKYNDIDIIISDVMMPRMDGIELCRRVKENMNFSHIPVILLTAKNSNVAKEEGMENGADVYMEKPFSIKQLHLQIVNLFKLRNQFYERMSHVKTTENAQPANEGELGMNNQDIKLMEKMNQLIQENISDEDFSIDQLAESLNMSRSSFYRKLKSLTGVKPVDYIRNARLEYAAKLLAEGRKTTEVAAVTGFTSPSYFTKCFKAKFGILPKDYVLSGSTPNR